MVLQKRAPILLPGLLVATEIPKSSSMGVVRRETPNLFRGSMTTTRQTKINKQAWSWKSSCRSVKTPPKPNHKVLQTSGPPWNMFEWQVVCISLAKWAVVDMSWVLMIFFGFGQCGRLQGHQRQVQDHGLHPVRVPGRTSGLPLLGRARQEGRVADVGPKATKWGLDPLKWWRPFGFL